MVNSFEDRSLNESWANYGQWNSNDGWSGVIPGRTSFTEVKSKFGEPDGSWRTANATFYSFVPKPLNLLFSITTKTALLQN